MNDFERAIKELEKSEKELNDWIDAYSENRLYYPLEVRKACMGFSRDGYYCINFSNEKSILTEVFTKKDHQEDLLGLHLLIIALAKEYNKLEQAKWWAKINLNYTMPTFYQKEKDVNGSKHLSHVFSKN